MQLQHNNPTERYAEEGQSRPCVFFWAYVKDGKLQTDHGPVLCRDFLGDTLVWKAKEPVYTGEIYRWNYRGKVETEYTSLVIGDFGKIEKNVVRILNPIEQEIGVELTTVEKTEDGQHVWVKGDKFWMLTTVHFSWYTTLLRYLTYNRVFKDFDEMQKYPTNYWMNEAFPRFKKLPFVLKSLEVTQVAGCKHEYADNSGTLHDYNGWYSNTEFNNKSNYTAYGAQLKKLLGA